MYLAHIAQNDGVLMIILPRARAWMPSHKLNGRRAPAGLLVGEYITCSGCPMLLKGAEQRVT
jgi:hypothetical protein